MDWLQITILALIQGLTEFLPVSSSAHLILAPYFFSYEDQGLAFDIAVHVGTLGAVMLYFKQEVWSISKSLVLFGDSSLEKDRRLGLNVIVATLPVIVVGLTFKDLVSTELRSPLVIATTTIVFGILLLIADKKAKRQKGEDSITWRGALIIGCFQAIAIIPGTSRSGITMTAGLFLGLTRSAASRFSFLLSIPTILMSGGLITLELILSEAEVAWTDLISGAILSFIAAYVCIHYFLKLIESMGMMPFVIYRFLLGAILVWMFYI
jgi:undecaprenyl-diphosphatase